VDILITSAGLERSGDVLRAAAPAARWVHVDQDGTVRLDGREIDRTDAAPEVAWLSSDLVQGGPVHRFFGIVAHAPSLRWLQSSAAGFDAPVFADLLARGVRLTTSHIAGPPIADFVLRAALDHLQDADAWRAAQAERRWAPHEITEMADTTWLVVGMGAIGAEVAVRARACGATVVGVRRSPTGAEPADEMIGPDAVRGALARADVVVLATPASASTTGLVDARFLAAMRPGSLLVNIGRGALVDEPALLAALDSGTPGRAALDVTATEPLPVDDPLWAHPRVVLTPHSSALGGGRHGRAARVFAQNLRRYTAGDALLHEVTTVDLE